MSSEAIFAEDQKGDQDGAIKEEEGKPEAGVEGAEVEGAESEEIDSAAGDAGSEEVETVEKEASEEKVELEYKLELPKDSSLDDVHIDEIAEFSKEQGLSQEQAQAILTRESEIVADMLENAKSIVEEQSQAIMEKASNQWLEDVKNDPEIGGSKAAETAELTKRFVDAYFPENLRNWLEETGFGNHPGAVKAFRRAAMDLGIGGDNFEKGGNVTTPKKKSDSDLFYGTKTEQ